MTSGDIRDDLYLRIEAAILKLDRETLRTAEYVLLHNGNRTDAVEHLVQRAAFAVALAEAIIESCCPDCVR